MVQRQRQPVDNSYPLDKCQPEDWVILHLDRTRILPDIRPGEQRGPATGSSGPRCRRGIGRLRSTACGRRSERKAKMRRFLNTMIQMYLDSMRDVAGDTIGDILEGWENHICDNNNKYTLLFIFKLYCVYLYTCTLVCKITYTLHIFISYITEY